MIANIEQHRVTKQGTTQKHKIGNNTEVQNREQNTQVKKREQHTGMYTELTVVK